MTRRTEDVARARRAVRNAGVTYGPPPPRRRPTSNSWQDFSHRYGWRAYALPVLLVVTIAALMTTTTGAGKHHAASAGGDQAGDQAPPQALSSSTLKADLPGPRHNDRVLTAAALPAGPPYTESGNGTFQVLNGTSEQVGTGQLYRYDIEVERGITGVDLKHFQQLVVQTLSDSRSWSGHGVALQRVDSGQVDFHISLTSSMSVRNLCGYDVPVETSCYVPAGGGSNVNRVVLNDARYTRGATAYLGDLNTYRIYMINHETGHALGHQHAHQCLSDGLAPAMMQQTFGLRSAATGNMCEANPWPYPKGATDAPGAEQQDTRRNNEYNLGDG
jgi:hypothetical protein